MAVTTVAVLRFLQLAVRTAQRGNYCGDLLQPSPV